ncbi:MAG: UDP-N-acetylglucosamine 1-carboxyvinyltransferase [Candidatus Eisenbacteria bacterium]|uniref:UDP-N-acetylglucosamine 1-carboxyvinyltransferase n=1 Tax=Eiseniibacteriota bacterium TaxID=2212470 RepID=A0A956LZ04_UNCEI|nr:UDP-N-acetylglucosamine 1-carboxyvinyltransferase [Candidatus Eisenbacteria bacterium]
MDAFRIVGGRRLEGTLPVSGAKNAALPMMAAALLIPGRSIIHNVPHLRDVVTMHKVLAELGARGGYPNHSFEVDATELTQVQASWDLVRTMRASIYVLGPLLARMGRAKVSLPGGCAWGPRPVDLHLRGMELLGAKVELDHGYIVAEAPAGGLRGAHIAFDISSVGATGNVLMAATLARGTTVIENASREPEIVALADFLIAAGAKIQGQGTTTITIDGVSSLSPVEFDNIPDRIEAGTFIAAAAITGGQVNLVGARPDHLAIVFERFRDMGVRFAIEAQSIQIEAPSRLRATRITTAPYPGFPTDLQAVFLALLSVAEGTGVVTETIYPDRFTHVPELARMGADIVLSDHVATVRGTAQLSGALVTSTDLRASSALVLAGLVAKGETLLHRVYHIDRGYERIEDRLRGVGANIERVSIAGP